MNKKRLNPKRKLHIVHVVAELHPFFRSGGLGVVANALPRALCELGQQVTVVVPCYEALITKEVANEYKIELVGSEMVEVKNGEPHEEQVDFYRGYFDNGVPIYFVAHKRYFGERKTLYGSKTENSRFYLFDLGVLALLRRYDIRADIIHCHDWHTGLIPYLLRTRYKSDTFWSTTATVFTIHNLSYQLGHDWWRIKPRLRDDGYTALPELDSPQLERINFSKRGIRYADAVNTVSETYRDEIMTKNFGEELHRILKNREKTVYGIVNGIDYENFNPLTDPGITQHYSEKSIERKAANKEWVQRHFKLKVGSDIPLICMTSRIIEQKGYKLLLIILGMLLRSGIQCVVMGDGDKKFVRKLEKFAKKYPKSFVLTPFDRKYETSLYAGADIFLLPSRFEPCGINQMIALRYGCIPVVHHIGGLADTIEDYDPRTAAGNGFTFTRYTSRWLLVAVMRAVENYKHSEAWKALIITAMREANSWRLPAQKYIELYYSALRLHAKNKE